MTKKRPPDFGDRESRLRKAYERLGTNNPRCMFCSVTNPLLLELHHPAQHEFDSATIIVCSNHHKNASDWQKNHQQKLEGCTSALEPMAHWLLGLGDLARIVSDEPSAAIFKELLIFIAEKLGEIARALIGMARDTIGHAS
jgi:hypothetical protein